MTTAVQIKTDKQNQRNGTNRGFQVKTQLKAGGIHLNHNETQVRRQLMNIKKCVTAVAMGATFALTLSSPGYAADDEGPCTQNQINSGEYKTVRFGETVICEFVGGTTEGDLPDVPYSGEDIFPGWVPGNNGACGGGNSGVYMGYVNGVSFNIAEANIDYWCDEDGEITVEDDGVNIVIRCRYPEGDGFNCYNTDTQYRCEDVYSCNAIEAPFTPPCLPGESFEIDSPCNEAYSSDTASTGPLDTGSPTDWQTVWGALGYEQGGPLFDNPFGGGSSTPYTSPTTSPSGSSDIGSSDRGFGYDDRTDEAPPIIIFPADKY